MKKQVLVKVQTCCTFCIWIVCALATLLYE